MEAMPGLGNSGDPGWGAQGKRFKLPAAVRKHSGAREAREAGEEALGVMCSKALALQRREKGSPPPPMVWRVVQSLNSHSVSLAANPAPLPQEWRVETRSPCDARSRGLLGSRKGMGLGVRKWDQSNGGNPGISWRGGQDDSAPWFLAEWDLRPHLV